MCWSIATKTKSSEMPWSQRSVLDGGALAASAAGVQWLTWLSHSTWMPIQKVRIPIVGYYRLAPEVMRPGCRVLSTVDPCDVLAHSQMLNSFSVVQNKCNQCHVLINCSKDKKLRNAPIATITSRQGCACSIGTMANVVITFNVNAYLLRKCGFQSQDILHTGSWNRYWINAQPRCPESMPNLLSISQNWYFPGFSRLVTLKNDSCLAVQKKTCLWASS